ncbi:hypothetical protein F5Y18DRAFT_254784 [Xylariaceae sp. FL1019]|nr:hypothetical protein F5Y18DRAFT_254784 [Xylariaceae sp. FL1019]
MPTTEAEAAPEWTTREDRTICLMKAVDSTWAEIGAKLNRGKSECKHRYRSIGLHAKELGLTVERLAKMYLDDIEETKESEKKGKSKAKPKATKKQKVQVTTDTEDEDSDEEYNKRSKKSTKKQKEQVTTDTEDEDSDEEYTKRSKKSKDKSRDKSKQKTKSSRKDTGKKKKTPSTSTISDTSTSSRASYDSPSEEEEEDEYDLAAEIQDSRRYQYDNMFSWMYPDQRRLRADRFYSESDCRVLAGLEARYRANKWLNIQADFCNATGRMVEGEMLKAKFYEKERMRGEM